MVVNVSLLWTIDLHSLEFHMGQKLYLADKNDHLFLDEIEAFSGFHISRLFSAHLAAPLHMLQLIFPSSHDRISKLGQHYFESHLNLEGHEIEMHCPLIIITLKLQPFHISHLFLNVT